MALSCNNKIIGNFCLYCFHSFKTKNELESHKKVYKDNFFFEIVMHSKDTKIIKFHIFVDCNSLLKKVGESKSNLKTIVYNFQQIVYKSS